jgi:hypothetical protein
MNIWKKHRGLAPDHALAMNRCEYEYKSIGLYTSSTIQVMHKYQATLNLRSTNKIYGIFSGVSIPVQMMKRT